jgi:hypothetical protein
LFEREEYVQVMLIGGSNVGYERKETNPTTQKKPAPRSNTTKANAKTNADERNNPET